MSLARNNLTEPREVQITHAMPFGPKLIAAVFSDDGADREDLYNCTDEEVRKAILECTPEAPVKCVVSPDDKRDADKHPSIKLA